VNYVFVLDALNFCFWPFSGWEYDNLASSLKEIAEKTPQFLYPENLANVTLEEVKERIFKG
jgi:hypothetical protein